MFTFVTERDLWVLELSTPHARETLGTPNVKYIGDIHGNEVVAGEVLFQFTHVSINIYLIWKSRKQ